MSLFDSSSKAAKFDAIGTTVTGTVKSAPRERQQTKYNSQEPDFWPNGDPKMQILVDLQTDQRADANDDGERTLYVASKNMKRAISEAIRNAGAADLLPGGVLTVQYVGNDPKSANPQNPAKLYQAQYTAPTSAFAAQPAAAAPAPQQAPLQQPLPATPQPVQQQPAAPAQQPQAPFTAPAGATHAGGLTDEQVGQLQQLRAAGLPAEMVTNAMGAVGVTPQMIAAFDNTPF
ncbi:hypothetical protein [Microbacterium proteolyticum]|uniref:hypothetical protein n=1 Tax=Microbacterium proteolyticum TaxID=1572644 RepID=UPI0035C1212F